MFCLLDCIAKAQGIGRDEALRVRSCWQGGCALLNIAAFHAFLRRATMAPFIQGLTR